jgi:N-acetylmuramoyl-L-alanine amidase/AmpD protein
MLASAAATLLSIYLPATLADPFSRRAETDLTFASRDLPSVGGPAEPDSDPRTTDRFAWPKAQELIDPTPAPLDPKSVEAPLPVYLGLPAIQAPVHDVFPGDPFPTPWTDPGFKKLVWISSPNFGRRPDTAVVDTVVIHATVIPTLKDTAQAFYRTSSQVSSHFTIGKDGSIVQSVSTFNRAWHAGASRDFRGYDNLNNFSIGIELVNLDDGKDPYPKPQIEALKALIRVLKRRFPLKELTSHEYVALPAGRKNDPAGFPWHDLADLGLHMTYEGHAPLQSVPIPTN